MEARNYLTNFRVLTFGECRRMGGSLGKGGLFWLLTRFAAPGNPMRLPQLASDLAVPREAMAVLALEKLAGPLGRLTGLGYRVVAYQRMERSPNPENGGFIALGPDGRKVAFGNFIRQASASSSGVPRDVVTLGLQVFCESGGFLGVTDFAAGLDPRPNCKSVYLASADPVELERRLDRLVATDSRPIATFAATEDVLHIVDREELANLRDRVERRRLFVPAP